MKRLNLILTAFVILVTAGVQAQTSPNAHLLLERDLIASKRIGTFSSVRRLYHYFWMGNQSTQVDGLFN